MVIELDRHSNLIIINKECSRGQRASACFIFSFYFIKKICEAATIKCWFLNITKNIFTIWDVSLIYYIFSHFPFETIYTRERGHEIIGKRPGIFSPHSALKYNRKILNRDTKRLKKGLGLYWERITFMRYLRICCTCWQRYYNTHGWSKIFWKSALKCIFILGMRLLNRLVSSSIVYYYIGHSQNAIKIFVTFTSKGLWFFSFIPETITRKICRHKIIAIDLHMRFSLRKRK